MNPRLVTSYPGHSLLMVDSLELYIDVAWLSHALHEQGEDG
jgi:hypothetical protein